MGMPVRTTKADLIVTQQLLLTLLEFLLTRSLMTSSTLCSLASLDRRMGRRSSALVVMHSRTCQAEGSEPIITKNCSLNGDQ